MDKVASFALSTAEMAAGQAVYHKLGSLVKSSYYTVTIMKNKDPIKFKAVIDFISTHPKLSKYINNNTGNFHLCGINTIKFKPADIEMKGPDETLELVIERQIVDNGKKIPNEQLVMKMPYGVDLIALTNVNMDAAKTQIVSRSTLKQEAIARINSVSTYKIIRIPFFLYGAATCNVMAQIIKPFSFISNRVHMLEDSFNLFNMIMSEQVDIHYDLFLGEIRSIYNDITTKLDTQTTDCNSKYKNILSHLIDKSIASYNKKFANNVQTWNYSSDIWTEFSNDEFRHMDTIILQPGQKELIRFTLDKFLSGSLKKCAYLFYGEPGTGKSTLALGIASMLKEIFGYAPDKANLYTLSLSTPGLNMSNIMLIIKDVPEYCILMIEDIDQIMTEKLGFTESDLTNILDGITCPLKRRIVVLTTNNYSQLSERLTRDVRIDLKLEIECPSQNQMNEYIDMAIKYNLKPELYKYKVNEEKVISDFTERMSKKFSTYFSDKKTLNMASIEAYAKSLIYFYTHSDNPIFKSKHMKKLLDPSFIDESNLVV